MNNVNDWVFALAVVGSDLYAGGQFTTAGGVPANRIAKWDGSSWSALGSGMNSTVLALAVVGSDLYAGGNFTSAGGKVSTYMAKAILTEPPQILIGWTTNGNQLSLSLSGTANQPYILEAAPNLTPPVPWQPIFTNTADANGNWQFVDTNLNSSQKFYRALSP